MEEKDFTRRFEIYQMSKNRSLVIDLYKDANEKQRKKILDHEEKRLRKTKITKGSDDLPSASEQKDLINKLKSIR
jgi:hypothetical protein